MQAALPSAPDNSLPAAFPAVGHDDWRFVQAVARRIVEDADAAADVAQDALLTAFRHRHTFRGDSNYRTWLYRITVTTALTFLRRQQTWRGRMVPMDHEELTVHNGSAPDTPADRLHDAQAAAAMAQEVAALPQAYRQVIELRLAQGCSTEETAQRLGISVPTVKIRTFRARRMLRERLAA